MGRELRGPVQARLLFTGNIGKHIESGYNFIRSTTGHRNGPWANPGAS